MSLRALKLRCRRSTLNRLLCGPISPSPVPIVLPMPDLHRASACAGHAGIMAPRNVADHVRRRTGTSGTPQGDPDPGWRRRRAPGTLAAPDPRLGGLQQPTPGRNRSLSLRPQLQGYSTTVGVWTTDRDSMEVRGLATRSARDAPDTRGAWARGWFVVLAFLSASCDPFVFLTALWLLARDRGICGGRIPGRCSWASPSRSVSLCSTRSRRLWECRRADHGSRSGRAHEPRRAACAPPGSGRHVVSLALASPRSAGTGLVRVTNIY